MIIQEQELKDIIIFTIKPYLKQYGFHLLNSQLTIKDHIYIDATISYSNNDIKINGYFDIHYQNNQFIFDHIVGTVKYSIIELTIIQVLKQFLSSHIINDSYIYYMTLPIETIKTLQHHIEIIIKSD